MKVAVIGIGGTGSAALRFLARDGHTAVGLEQFDIGHSWGSSHGESRIIRYTYPDAMYTAMMADAYPLWDELETQANQELFVRCGGIYFGPQTSPKVQRTEAALVESGLPFEKCDYVQAMQRVPGLRLFPHEIAIFQASSGFLRAGDCVRANAHLALEAGAIIHENTQVLKIENRGAQVLVESTQGEELFDRAIVTSGPWMSQMFAPLRSHLEISRQQFVYLAASQAHTFAPENFPVWIDAGEIWYGFPSDDRVEGVKFASHTRGETFDPNRTEREVNEQELKAAIEYASRRMPELNPQVLAAWSCLYSNTPDEDFILDLAPNLENVWLVSGCSGHGFKFTVLLGKIAAMLVNGESYARDLSRFSLSRFS